MQEVVLGNRPVQQAPMSKLLDFEHEGKHIRVSIKLSQADPVNLVINAQAFEVDANGVNITAPDGRPSRTGDTGHSVIMSALGDTHTLKPGWTRIVGQYDQESFEASAPRGTEKPVAEPDWATNPTGQFYNTATDQAWKWDSEGEVFRLAKAKVEEMMNIIRNSAPLAGLDF